jgi:hypothetical protein
MAPVPRYGPDRKAPTQFDPQVGQAGAVRSPVLVYNPLPAALRHFETELVSVLATTGHEIIRVPVGSAEIGHGGAADRMRAACRDLLGRLQTSRIPGHVVVCWPVLGLAEPALWATASAQTRVTVLVHDPVPLRRQVGMGTAARTLGRLGANHPRVTVAVHSTPAATALREFGWPAPAQLPHPLLPRLVELAADRDVILVCGQYKPARDLRLLERLAAPLKDAGLRPVIRGRGWPQVAGWEVDEGFLSEDALDESLAESAAVLIPYAHFFQSGVAVRALELGVPVVGPRHEFLADLMGQDWPGLVDSEDPAIWAHAASDVIEQSDVVQHRLVELRASCERDWTAYLN